LKFLLEAQKKLFFRKNDIKPDQSFFVCCVVRNFKSDDFRHLKKISDQKFNVEDKYAEDKYFVNFKKTDRNISRGKS
jgi:hypothetical protein